MDDGNAALIISSILILVVLFNAAIYVAAKRRKTIGQIDMLQRAAKRAFDPWGDENAKMEELARLVAKLQGGEETENNDR